MTQEEKQLLLRDLCARLPYRVKGTVTYRNGVGKIYNVVKYINGEIYYKFSEKSGIWYDNIVIKPYLYPLSSMTEEQKEIYCQLQQRVIYNSKGLVTKDVMNYINWCYENHLDINDLIPKDLAIDATGLNIY